MLVELCFDIHKANSMPGNISSQSSCDTMIFLIHSSMLQLQCSTLPITVKLFKLYIYDDKNAQLLATLKVGKME